MVLLTAWQGLLTRTRRAFRAFESEKAEGQAIRPLSFTVALNRDTLDGGWVAECLELPGCMSQGETQEEALRSLVDAIGEVLSLQVERAIPEPSADGGQVRRVAMGV